MPQQADAYGNPSVEITVGTAWSLGRHLQIAPTSRLPVPPVVLEPTLCGFQLNTVLLAEARGALAASTAFTHRCPSDSWTVCPALAVWVHRSCDKLVTPS